MNPTLDQLMAVASEAAYLGGRRTLAYFNTGIAVETKADQTPVTQADREAEHVIRERILRSFPDHSILGEEGGETTGNSMYRWIIDPIDGTKSFIHGVPFYAVLIGLEIAGQAQVGVVYVPALDEMVSAASGQGCLWNGRPANVSTVASLAEATVVTTSVTSCMNRSDAYGHLVRQTKLQRTWGDAYGYVLVATGRAEIMLDPAMNPWDCAPFLPILQEAGGSFSTWQGEKTIWGPDAVGTNAVLNQPVLDILRNEQPSGGTA